MMLCLGRATQQISGRLHHPVTPQNRDLFRSPVIIKTIPFSKSLYMTSGTKISKEVIGRQNLPDGTVGGNGRGSTDMRLTIESGTSMQNSKS